MFQQKFEKKSFSVIRKSFTYSAQIDALFNHKLISKLMKEYGAILSGGLAHAICSNVSPKKYLLNN